MRKRGEETEPPRAERRPSTRTELCRKTRRGETGEAPPRRTSGREEEETLKEWKTWRKERLLEASGDWRT